jgi:excisionase family DNA binding protein
MTQILTVKDAAVLLQLEEETVREWLRKGWIPGRRIGRIWRINEDELLEFLCSTPSTKQAK